MADAQPKPVVPLLFEGPLTVRTIAAVHGTLLAALAGQQMVQVDCAGAETVDLSFIQLLLAARRSATNAGKQFQLAAPAAGALRTTLEQGGFLSSDGADPFWSGAA